MEPLNKIFEDATKLEHAAIDIVVAVHERSSVNWVTYSEGWLRFYPKGYPGLGSTPLFWSGDITNSSIKKFDNHDRYKNSKGISCPFDGEHTLSMEIMIAEITYISKVTFPKSPKGTISSAIISAGTVLGGSQPAALAETSKRYLVRIRGLAQSPTVEFEPNYEPNSKILTAIVKGTSDLKFVTISLRNLREYKIE